MTFSIVFPGQGSQSVGMQAALAAAFPEVEETFAEAGEVLGFDLWRMVRDGPADTLNLTVNTQPAVLAAGVAAWRCWKSAGGGQPAAGAGHSLGEYSALVCAGALGFREAVALVRRRAELMQGAVPTGRGAMAAILGLDDQAVIDVCAAAAEGQVVSAVNFNAPGQVVIAGETAAVERAAEQARAAGARRAVLLNVSVPSHCALMEPAALEFSKYLDETDFGEPEFPIVNVVDVEVYDSPQNIRDGLRRQLHSPVRWVETVRKLTSDGVDCVVECGPGKVLAGLAKRIDRSVASCTIDDPDTLETARERCGSASQS